MIHYQLRCETDPAHAFDGWFKDSAAFDKLAAAGLVQCPSCGGTRVSRALMTPAIGKGREEPPPAQPAKPPVPPVAAPQRVAAGPMPAELRALFQRMRAEVEKNCDYVGRDFAEEARKMHQGESDRRGIYGETSDEEAEALRDEGIEIARIPWVPPADA
jgi:hypothetical protein